MRLRPHQYVGIAAVIVFGGLLVWQLTQPKRDPFSLPGAMPLDTKAYDEKTIEDGFGSPGAIPPPDAATAVIGDPLGIGSDDAKDDLYCSGLLLAVHGSLQDRESAEAQQLRDRGVTLADRGTSKLVAAGAADASHAGPIAEAHSARASTDYGNGTPRIPLVDCEARADAK